MTPSKKDWDNWPGENGKPLTAVDIIEVMLNKHKDPDEDFDLFEEGPSV